MEVRAYQIQAMSSSDGTPRVYYVAAETGEGAVAAMVGYPEVAPGTLKLQRRLSDAEVDMFNIGPDTIFRYR